MAHLPSFLTRLFTPKAAVAKDASLDFASRFHRFRLFLSAYTDAYGEIMNFEERIAGELPIGMPFLRTSTAKLTISTMQCVLQLNALGKGQFSRLDAPFSALREKMQCILNSGATELYGPLVMAYNAIGQEHRTLVSPNLYKLQSVRLDHPEYLPRGFVVSGAAWWRYFNNPDMHDEIDRLMVISDKDPGGYAEASARIRERMTSDFPLPEELQTELAAMLASYPEMDMPGYAVVVRCLPVHIEHGALVLPEQVLHTPLDKKTLFEAVLRSFSQAYRPRAILYRLKRGIRDRAMPLCVSLTLLPEVHGRGSAHRKLESPESDELHMHIRRGFTSPDTLPNLAADERASLPREVQTRLEKSILTALDSLADAPVNGNRHEIFWAVAQTGRLYIMGVNALPDPGDYTALEKAQEKAVLFSCDGGPEICLSGGLSTYPGSVEGRAYPVRNFTDALAMPFGSVLILRQASPRWSFLLDFASGAVAGDGTGNGMFARTARRYGRPTVLRQPEAYNQLESGKGVQVLASGSFPPVVRQLPVAPDLPRVLPRHDTAPGAAFALDGGSQAAVNSDTGVPIEDIKGKDPLPGERRAPLWLPSSPVANMAGALIPEIVPLTLPDSDHVDFRAENCKTFQDILTYCHVHAVQEMLRAGTERNSVGAPAKQLVCDVPKQFWVVNLEGGFTRPVPGPVVQLEEIASLPLLALWEGFTDKPWEGPPQLNAKGFLSVLFEASANPNLDPAIQSAQYSEKNLFLISQHFCSMRCRFGFHFLSMDALIGKRPKERFIVFQFKGGAANLQRRIRRVHFVAELLSQFDFMTEIVRDTLTARMEKGEEEDFLSALRVLGYITMHTRQLDMIMGDEAALAAYREQMLGDMADLAGRRS